MRSHRADMTARLARAFAGMVLGGFVWAAAAPPPVQAGTKIVDVGPDGTLTFGDRESGTDTTTVSVGDRVEWDWVSGFHSPPGTLAPETWDSLPRATPFSFSHTF